MGKRTIEVDTLEGEKLLLKFRDDEGRRWMAGAFVSKLEPVEHDAASLTFAETRDTLALELTEFTVVIS